MAILYLTGITSQVRPPFAGTPKSLEPPLEGHASIPYQVSPIRSDTSENTKGLLTAPSNDIFHSRKSFGSRRADFGILELTLKGFEDNCYWAIAEAQSRYLTREAVSIFSS